MPTIEEFYSIFHPPSVANPMRHIGTYSTEESHCVFQWRQHHVVFAWILVFKILLTQRFPFSFFFSFIFTIRYNIS